MSHKLTVTIASVLGLLAVFAADDPVAAKEAQVICGKARFTVLTDRLIRMEYARDGKFEDRATFTFVNRKLDTPTYRVRKEGEGVIIDTGAVKLTYRGGEFAPNTLSAAIGKGFSWTYGETPAANLLGTTRTLDACGDYSTLIQRMEKGLVSRDGWAVVDDSKSLCFVPVEGRCWDQWVAERGEIKTDLYLFAYGHDYRAALNDYTKVAGKIPMLPRWAFGYWWSRYWQYSDLEIKDLVRNIERLGIPIDVFIIDMDWHETWDGRFGSKDEFDQPIGWTGYTWKEDLFTAPEKLLGYLHEHDLVTALNLHPASGIQPWEECYERFCQDYGWDASTKRAVPYKGSELKWADAYFRSVLEPIERQGVDFWWLDWQQWIYSRYVPGLNCTFWLNYYFYKHSEAFAQGARPFIYHRWGGLGSHRYQAGFSGDTFVRWEALGILPFFTATAANVGYGYWGHDIGGHMNPGTLGGDPELFTRWLQSAVFTPIFKTHCCKDPSIERRIWAYPEHQFHMMDAIRLRYDLAPYIYGESRRCYDTGASICHPLYWDWPEIAETYDQTYPELMFGNDILAVTVASPTDPKSAMSEVTFYLPPGKWFDMATGELLEGGRECRRSYTIAENPYFVKAGAVIPKNVKSVKNLKHEPEAYAFQVTPGAVNGYGLLYEDAGNTIAYPDEWAQTRVEWSRSEDGRRLVAQVMPRRGKYAGMRERRHYEFELPNVLPPVAVKVNGRKGEWSYDGRELTLYVKTPEVRVDRKTTIEVEFSEQAVKAEGKLNGVKGLIKRLDAISAELKLEYRQSEKLPPDYLRLAALPSRLENYPETAPELIASIDERLAAGKKAIEKIRQHISEKLYSSAMARLGGAEVRGHVAIPAAVVEVFVDYRPDNWECSGRPAFSWRTACEDPTRLQKAYRIVVRDGEEVMWDSGIVIEESASGIVYAGRQLTAGREYTATVATRDQHFDWTKPKAFKFRVAAAGTGELSVAHGQAESLAFKCLVAHFNDAFAGQPAGVNLDFGLSDNRSFIDEAVLRPHAIYSLWGDARVMDGDWERLRKWVETELPRRQWANDYERLVRTTMDMWYLKEMATCRRSVPDQEFYAEVERKAREEFAAKFVVKGFLKPEIMDLRQMLDALHARFVWHLVVPEGKSELIRRIKAKLAADDYRVEGGRDFVSYLLDVLVFDCEDPATAYTVALKARPEQLSREWLIKVAGGIRPGDLRAQPGFKLFELAPCFDQRIGSVEASYTTVYGEIKSSWKGNGKGYEWNFTVPVNTKAQVRHPERPWEVLVYGPGTHRLDIGK